MRDMMKRDSEVMELKSRSGASSYGRGTPGAIHDRVMVNLRDWTIE
jgi:hypothetical protein